MASDARLDLVTVNGDVICVAAVDNSESVASFWVTRLRQSCADPASQRGMQALLTLDEVWSIIDTLTEIAGPR